jgi:pimeloyl-ACP methyl ester carboxylesterase
MPERKATKSTTRKAAGRVIALDQRGLGRSTESAEGYGMEQWAEDVVCLLDHLDTSCTG